jgi:hypothetical protein
MGGPIVFAERAPRCPLPAYVQCRWRMIAGVLCNGPAGVSAGIEACDGFPVAVWSLPAGPRTSQCLKRALWDLKKSFLDPWCR